MFLSPKRVCITVLEQFNSQDIRLLSFAQKQLLINCHTDEQSKSKLLKLLEIILHHNCFQHENKFFKPNKGIRMKSLTSGLPAEIFLQYLERTFMYVYTVEVPVLLTCILMASLAISTVLMGLTEDLRFCLCN
jgi:hypothetical protein